MRFFARRYDLAKALRDRAPGPPPPDSTAFWDRFGARAAAIPQQREAAATVGRSPWQVPCAAAAAVAVAAVVALVAVTRHAPSPSSASALSEVSELDVYMKYSSVMIVADKQNRGTVIWLASAQVPNGS